MTQLTDDFEDVRKVMTKIPLQKLRLVWSWDHFKWMYQFEYDLTLLMRYYQGEITMNWIRFKHEISKHRPKE